MKRNTKYVANDGIEYFMCLFEEMYISQGSNSSFSHRGIMANDVRGSKAGVRYSYFAPCKMKCLKIYKNSGQSMWQSVNKVRFANGRVDYATMMIAHDDSQDCYVGQIVEQGAQIGNMGTRGNATGVHCHIQISQSRDSSWIKNKFGNYHFNNEYDLDDCYFVDNTNVIRGLGGNWKKISDVPVNKNQLYITNFNMKIRCGAGTNYPIKKVKDLTPDGKKHATSTNLNDDAIYKKGTVFTAKEIINNSDSSVWTKTPSGYICIKDNNQVYCTKK